MTAPEFVMLPGAACQVILDGKWRDCIALRSKPWRYGIEWAYQFDPYPVTDLATGISPSTGGYADVRYFRPREVAA